MEARDASTDAVSEREPLVLRFGGKLVEQLGAQLYPRVTASVAELVSNAWDGDARNVWIKIPFDEDWRRGAVIEVLDDGHGMDYEMARTRYLVVGRNRRLEPPGERSEGGRPLHGRKGIGKLAAFGTAGRLECVTLRDGETTAFAIDYDAVRTYDPNKDYPVELIEDPDPLVNPDTGEALAHGTRVRLKQLRSKRKTGEDVFRRSMERRFALDATKMSVFINGTALARFDVPLKLRFPEQGAPVGVDVTVAADKWGEESITYPTEEDPDGTRPVRWWIGFTEKPVADEDMRGVSVLARGKLAHRPFMFELTQGTTGQLYQEYLVGEVSADWIDSGTDASEDLIQSNRDQLQLDNDELTPFLEWGRGRVRWALAEFDRQRRTEAAIEGGLGEAVEAAVGEAPAASRRRLRTLAGRIASITKADDEAVAQAVKAVVDATDASAARRAAQDLRLEGDPDDDATWRLLAEAADAVADSRTALHEARRDALRRFLTAVREPPVRRLHQELGASPWILSPLLDELPVQTHHADDEVAVLEFPAVEPVVARLTVIAWAVGVSARTPPLAADGRVLQIADSWNGTGSADDERLSWPDALSASIAAHTLLIERTRAGR
jgi:hypothetical protein